MRILLTLLLLLTPSFATAQNCEEIRFARGAFSGDVVDVAPANGVLCYAVGVGNGQTAYVEMLEGPNVAFTIPGVAEATDYAQFRTRAGTFFIDVFQRSRAVSGQRFRLRVTVQ